jgi:RHS repeat-associated protein
LSARPHRLASNYSRTFTIRFPGQYHDAETGLHYNWNRYYDPGIGRYISADPIGQAGGINVYNYALNNPANLTDPTGQLPPLIAAALLGGALGGTLGGLGEYLANVAAGCEGEDRFDGVAEAAGVGLLLGGGGAAVGVAASAALGPAGAVVAGAATSGASSAVAEGTTGGSVGTTAGTSIGAAIGGAIAGPAGVVAGEFLGFATELLGGAVSGDFGADCGCEQ